MASWMVHLRVADKIIEEIKKLENKESKSLKEIEFIVGNIAPDSGVPNEDWSTYTPNKEISHFKVKDLNGNNIISDDKFITKYFIDNLREKYTYAEFSFYLGYLVHLWTDQLWNKNVYKVQKSKFAEVEKDKTKLIWMLKGDWYDLDMLYLKNNPKFHSFCIYEKATSFKNTYMNEFSKDAFSNRQKYIVKFYRDGKDGIERDYKYMTEGEMSKFVEGSVNIIMEKILKYKFL